MELHITLGGDTPLRFEIYQQIRRVILDGRERDLGADLEIWPSTNRLHVAALACHATIRQVDAWAARCATAGIGVQKLSMFRVDRPAVPGFALACGAIASEDIVQGLRRFRACKE